MLKEVREAMTELEEREKELAEQKRLLSSIEETDVLDEETWHAVCETPLRYSDLMARLARNVFPEAENVSVSANYVRFTLRGFRVEIPTSRAQGINVDVSWYEKDRGEPKFYPDAKTKRMMDFFEARDKKEGWRKQAKLLVNAPYRDWFLFLLWFGKYRRRVPDRAFWEARYAKELEIHKRSVEKYYAKRREVEEKTATLFGEVLPILERFSKKHFRYSEGGAFSPSIDEIRRAEFPEEKTAKS